LLILAFLFPVLLEESNTGNLCLCQYLKMLPQCFPLVISEFQVLLWKSDNFELIFFISCGYPVLPASFVEEIVLSLMCFSIKVEEVFISGSFILLYCSTFMNPIVCLEIRYCDGSSFVLLLKIALTSWCILCIHMNFRVVFPK
jgi:hypothetical protein